MTLAQITATISVAGVTVDSVTQRTAAGLIGQAPTLAAGLAGALTTRTDADTGIITMTDAEHGITDADTVDVFWDGGVRYGLTVTLVEGAAVSIDVGDGDALPEGTTPAVVVGVRQEIDVDFDGDLVELIAAHCPRRAHVEFLTNADVSLKAQELTAGDAWSFVADTGVANPLTGDPVGKLQVSCGETIGGLFNLIGIFDSE